MKKISRQTFQYLFLLNFILVPNAIAQQINNEKKSDDKEKSQKKEEVVIKGKKPEIIYKADRTIYNIGEQPQYASSTGRDIISNLPGVSILDNEVIIRGDKAIVSVNGYSIPKEVAFQISGSMIEAIEVVTNPSAANNSSAIASINIILKPIKQKGISGRFNYSISNRKKLTIFSNINANNKEYTFSNTLSANLDLKRKSVKANSSIIYSGLQDGLINSKTTQSIGDSYSINSTTILNKRISDKKNLILALINHKNKNNSLLNSLSLWDGINNANLNDYSAKIITEYEYSTNVIGAFLLNSKTDSINRRVLTQDISNKDLYNGTLSITYNETAINNNYSFENFYLNNINRKNSAQIVRHDNKNNLSFNYVSAKEFKANDILQYGINFQKEIAIFDYTQTGIGNGIIAQRDEFKVENNQIAGFILYQKARGKFSYVAGLRYENVDLHLNTKGKITNKDKGYIQIIPSLHFLYDINNDVKIKSSYSRRTEAFSLEQLNPNPKYTNYDSYNVGNPDLKPTKINSYELELIYSKKKYSVNLASYNKNKLNEINNYYYLNNDNVFVGTYINLGRSNIKGIDFTFKANAKKLLYSFNYNLKKFDKEYFINSVAAHDSYLENSGKIRLDYLPNKIDSYSLGLSHRGETRAINSKTTPASYLDFSYNRKLKNNWNMSIKYNTIIGPSKYEVIRESKNYKSSYSFKQEKNDFLISFAKTF